MVWAAFAAVIAAAGVNNPAADEMAERKLDFHKERLVEAEKPVVQILRAVATGAAAIAVYESADQPIEFYPLRFENTGSGFSLADKLRMKRGGFDFAVSAFSPKMTSEAGPVRDARTEARKMSKVIPGYPQPAQLVVGVKISF